MSKILGAALQSKIKEMATVAVLKCYIKYLVKSNSASSVESVNEKIGKICSSALDRGELTQVSIEGLTARMRRSDLFLKTVEAENCRDKFLDISLVAELKKTDSALLSQEDADLVRELKDLSARMAGLRETLVYKYGDLFMGECNSFYREYKNLFDPGFEKHMTELLGDVDTESHIAF